jgi:enoyl-CoA hydratase/carnithine racemase
LKRSGHASFLDNSRQVAMGEPHYETIVLEQRAAVAVVTLNRPQSLNAINMQMRRELHAVMGILRRDDAVGAVVLTAAGDKAFSAGMDLREFSQVLAQTPLPELRRYRWEPGEGIADFDKPVIAAVQGLAIGGGVELSLMCDISFAAQTASFAFAEVTRGLIPGNGGTQRLTRRVGRSKALDMILSGRTVQAEEALAMGLVDYVVPADQLLDRAVGLAQQMAGNAPVAVRAAKSAIVRGEDMSLHEGLNLERDLATFLYTTHDAQEGPRAFVEKRLPRWQGR